MSTTPFVNFDHLQKSDAVFHRSRGAGQFAEYSPKAKRLFILMQDSAEGESFSSTDKGVFCTPDGCCIGELARNWQAPEMCAADEQTTYKPLAQAQPSAHGIWPVQAMMSSREQSPECKAAMQKYLQTFNIDGRTLGNGLTKPFLSHRNVHAQHFVDERGCLYFHSDYDCIGLSGWLGFDKQVKAVFPHHDRCSENQLKLLRIEVQPDKNEGVAYLEHHSGQVVAAYLQNFSYSAPYVQSVSQYLCELGAIGFDVRPVGTVALNTEDHKQLDMMQRPSFEAMDAAFANPENRFELCAFYNEPAMHNFVGVIVAARYRSWQPEFEAIFGPDAYELSVAVTRDDGKTKPLVVSILVQTEQLTAGWQPRSGQAVSGRCWLHASVKAGPATLKAY